MDQKKGILVVSFGTSHPVTRAATIEAIEDSISKAFADIKVYRAWTSKMIISKIQKNTMEKIPTGKRSAKPDGRGWNNRCLYPAHPCDQWN